MMCYKCGNNLTYNEIGLNKKLIGKTEKSYLCKQCLAQSLKVSVERLDEKQRCYIESGCCLFVSEEAKNG